MICLHSYVYPASGGKLPHPTHPPSPPPQAYFVEGQSLKGLLWHDNGEKDLEILIDEGPPHISPGSRQAGWGKSSRGWTDQSIPCILSRASVQKAEWLRPFTLPATCPAGTIGTQVFTSAATGHNSWRARPEHAALPGQLGPHRRRVARCRAPATVFWVIKSLTDWDSPGWLEEDGLGLVQSSAQGDQGDADPRQGGGGGGGGGGGRGRFGPVLRPRQRDGLEASETDNFSGHGKRPSSAEGEAACGASYRRVAQPPARAISFDINVEAGESSIIKKHPPRRFQRLEPINRFTVITAEELLKNQQATSTCKTQGQVQAEIAKQFSRRRQQMQKMQYEKKRQQEVIHLQKQAELMTTSQKETQNNEQKIKNHRAKKSRGKAQSHEQDQYHIAGEANDIFTAGYGNSWNDLTSMTFSINNNQFRIRKLLRKHQAKRNIFSITSSNESLDCWMDTLQSQHRSMRTNTEQIPMFDEFFDEDL